MVKKIYKYELMPGAWTILKGSFDEVLKIDWQNGKLCAWIMMDEEESEEEIMFWCIPTGAKFNYDMGMEYVDSVQEGPYVWHVFVTNNQSEIETMKGIEKELSQDFY